MTWDKIERRKLTDFSEIMDRLNTIDVNIGVLGNKVENIHSKINSHNGDIKERLDKHELTLYGNGIPGLTQKVNSIKDLEEKVDFHIGTDRFMYGILLLLEGWALVKLYLIK